MTAFNRNIALDLIAEHPGICDREIAEAVFGMDTPGVVVNEVCRQLAAEGVTRRRLRPDGLFGNFPIEQRRDGRAAD